MFKNILVGVDGSEHGQKAARVAGDIARSMQGALRVVVAYDPVPAHLGQPNLQEAINVRLDQTEDILRIALDEIGKIPGELKTDTLEGPAAKAILQVAKTRDVDLIVMGTRGLGRLAGLLVGSQSQEVVSNAECPVLLVR